VTLTLISDGHGTVTHHFYNQSVLSRLLFNSFFQILKIVVVVI